MYWALTSKSILETGALNRRSSLIPKLIGKTMIRLTWKISILNVYWFNQSTERKDICLRHQKLACEMIKNLNYCQYLYCQLTLFTPLTSLDTPWKHQKTRVFLMFSGGIKRNQWHEKPGLPHRHKIIKCHQKVKI